MFKRNRKEIQDIVGGALAAFVATIKAAVPIIGGMFKGLNAISKEVGGWKTIFEIIIGGMLAAKFLALAIKIQKAVLAVKGLGIAIGLLPKAAATAAVETELAVGGIGTSAETATGKVGALRAMLLALGSPAVLAAIALGGAAFLAYSMYKDAQATQTFDIPGSNNKHVELKNGVYTEVTKTASRGAGAFKRKTITEAQANKLTHGAVGAATTPGANSPGGWQTANLAAYQVNSGVDMADENAMIPLALKALAAKGYQVQVTSGYRTYAQQSALYARYVKSGFNIKYIAAKPGTSNHESGNAADVYVNGKPVDQSPGALAILKKYGLVADVAGDHEHLDLKGYGGTTNTTPVWGADPPWTKNTGPKPPTAKQRAAAAARALSAKLQIPITNDQTLVAHYKSLAASANTGPEIAKYLDDEAAALKKENVDLLASMQGKTAAQDAKIKQTISKNQDTIAGLHKAMVQALDMAKNAAAFTKFQAKLKTLAAQFTADSDYATVLVGDTADKYRSTLQKDLLSQAAVLQAQEKSLKSKLATATGKHKTQIQNELTQVTDSLASVQQSILSSLQGNVQSLQSKVATLFANVTQQFDDALGKLFFQNGMKTALEQQLADMQAQDQLSSLTDAIQSAKDQLAQDQTGGLAGVQWDAATGLTKNLYSAGAAKQIEADKKAIDAAQRQLDEYNLGIRAAQERANMDKEYASQVTSLNAKLAKLAEAFQNGTGSMDALRNLAAQYGIVISNVSIPDFLDLSSASTALKLAFMDLVNYIATVTGVAPKIPAGGGGGGGGSAPAGSPAGRLQDLHQQVVNGIISPADYYYMISGHKQEIPGMASGGIVRARPGGTIVRLAEGGQDEEVGPVGRGGGGDVHVHFDGPVYGTNADELARLLTPKIKSELLRDQKRNANTTGIK